MNIALFSYNFPHKKTQDFLFRLFLNGYVPKLVLAVDFIKLDIPIPTIRVKPRHVDTVHPRIICEQLGIKYFVVEHNSEECCHLLLQNEIEIGLISGARILKSKTIESVKKGIINIHPGLLPQVRGLDALQWAIYEGHKIGVTAHAINHSVDAGYVLKQRIIPEYPDDTLIDLSLRLEQEQTNIIAESIRLLNTTPLDMLVKIDERTPIHRKMPSDIEKLISDLLAMRLK